MTAQPGQLSQQTLGRVGDPSSKNTVQSDRGKCPALVGVYYISKFILFIIKFKNRKKNYGRKFFDEKRYFFFCETFLLETFQQSNQSSVCLMFSMFLRTVWSDLIFPMTSI